MKYINYPVKVFTTVVVAYLSLNAANAQAVLRGGIKAGYGVDGDIESDTSRNGGATTISGKGRNSDDWFKFTNWGGLTGVGIIDTTGAAVKKAAIAANPGGVPYVKNMKYSRNSIVNGRLLLDGIYGMDFSGALDSVIDAGTVLGGPKSWTLKQGSATGKSDIVDFASHVRRQGTTINDSLWMFLAMSFMSTNGTKEGTMELFVNDVRYDRSANPDTFANYGKEEGRVAWRFNTAGQVIKVGDMAISWSYNPSSGAFTVDPMIWVADSNRNTGNGAYRSPANFKYTTTGSNFWVPNANYGFQRIEPLSSSSYFAYANASVANQNASPFSTLNTSGNAATTFEANQLVELGLNMTALGVDPSNFTALNSNPCDVSFRTIIYRTTTSGTFNGSLKDFAGPYPFWRTTLVQQNGTDTLKCNKTTAKLNIPGTHSLAYFKWSALPGTAQLPGSINADSSITVTKPGRYLLEYASLQCEIKFDTVTVLQDTTKPVASASGVIDTTIWGSVVSININGGSVAQSINRMNTNAATFGPHKGFIWSWTGPLGFTSSSQNLTFDTSGKRGSYTLTLTETRNGCTSVANANITFLPVEFGKFHCSKTPEGVQLNWETYSEKDASHFNIEKWNGAQYQTIGRVEAFGTSSNTINYVFVDKKPSQGANVYRAALHAIGSDEVVYSEACVTNINGRNTNLPFVFNVYPNPGVGVFTVTSALNASSTGTVFLYDMSGRIIKSEELKFDDAGTAKLDLSSISSGMYMLGMVNDDLPQTVKVSIK